jgi:hypothetical protein
MVTNMPIEISWWVSPLFDTGYLTFFILTLTGMIWSNNFLVLSGLIPWAIDLVYIVVWFIANMLVLIWR